LVEIFGRSPYSSSFVTYSLQLMFSAFLSILVRCFIHLCHQDLVPVSCLPDTTERLYSPHMMRNTAMQQIRHMVVCHPVFVHFVWSNQCNILSNYIQVKVLLKWRLKLIVMTSLRIHMMTRLDHICVQCVTKGLEVKEALIVTNWHILERNCLNVVFVANNLHRLEILLYTAEFIVVINHTNVTCVTRHLVSLEV